MESVVLVDPDGSGLELVGDGDGGFEVLGVDTGGETVGGVVGHGDEIVNVLELGDGGDGAEDFLLHDLHLWGDVGEDGGLDEVALFSVAGSSGFDGGTVLLAVVDVGHDAVELELGDLWALEGLFVEWVSDGVLGDLGLEGFNELFVDAFLDVDTGASTAALTVVVEDSKVGPIDGS